MKIIQVQKQKYWQMRAMSALLVGGAIASSGESAFAQIQLPQPCQISPTLCNSSPLEKDPPHNPAKPLPPEVLQDILQRYPEAITQLTREDPSAVQKLKQGDPATIQKLLTIAPASRKQLDPYLQQQSQQMNQSTNLQQSP